MQSLLQAIYTTCAGNATLQALFPTWTPPNGSAWPAGTPYVDLAPEGAPFPRLVLSFVPVSNSQSKYGGGMAYEPVTIRFTVYGNASLLATAGNADTVTGVFDDLLPTLSSGHVINTVRTGQPTPRLDPERDKGGNDVWSATWTYDYSLSPR